MRRIDPHEFRDLVVHMKMCMKAPLGFGLHVHTIAEYRTMRCYIDGDRNRYFGGGFAIDNYGGLTNAFAMAKGQGDRLIGEAKARGARHLDCYEGYLSDLYGRHGFAVVEREPFDMKFADPRWSIEKHGAPDVLTMVLR